MRPTWADIDLDAIAHNVRVFRGLLGDSELCAVVKADAYGHGAVPVARVAVGAGATWLGVALVEEAAELREAGIGVPILVLSEPGPSEMAAVAALAGVSSRVVPVGSLIALPKCEKFYTQPTFRTHFSLFDDITRRDGLIFVKRDDSCFSRM